MPAFKLIRGNFSIQHSEKQKILSIGKRPAPYSSFLFPHQCQQLKQKTNNFLIISGQWSVVRFLVTGVWNLLKLLSLLSTLL